jgi:hypothetical protein
MEPLHNPNDRAPYTSTYSPKRSRWPGLLGAGAIVAAVLGVTMWAQHDDARKADAPLDKSARATTPAQPASGPADAVANTPGSDSASTPPGDASKVAAQPSTQRQ